MNCNTSWKISLFLAYEDNSDEVLKGVSVILLDFLFCASKVCNPEGAKAGSSSQSEDKIFFVLQSHKASCMIKYVVVMGMGSLQKLVVVNVLFCTVAHRKKCCVFLLDRVM